MSKLTQKDLLEEGFLRGAIRSAAKVAGGALGGIKAAADAGTGATLSGVGKGGGSWVGERKAKAKEPRNGMEERCN